jgi:hypothetical protein
MEKVDDTPFRLPLCAASNPLKGILRIAYYTGASPCEYKTIKFMANDSLHITDAKKNL